MRLLHDIAEWRRSGLSLKEISALLRRDRGALAAAVGRRKRELARLVRVIEVLERAGDELGVLVEAVAPRPARPRTLRSIEDARQLTGPTAR